MKIKYIDSLDMPGFFGNITQSAQAAREAASDALSKVAASGAVRAVGERGSEALSSVVTKGLEVTGPIIRRTTESFNETDIRDVLNEALIKTKEKMEVANIKRKELITRGNELRKQASSQLGQLKEEATEHTIKYVCSDIQKTNDNLQGMNEDLQKENEELSNNLILSLQLIENLTSLSIKFRLLDILYSIIIYNKDQYEEFTNNSSEIDYKFIYGFIDFTVIENYSGRHTDIYTNIINNPTNSIVQVGNTSLEKIKLITNNYIKLYTYLLRLVNNLISDIKINSITVNDDSPIGNTVLKYLEYRFSTLKGLVENYNGIDEIVSKELNQSGAGKYQPKKMNKKEILGKERCIYKKQGDKREYVKYKSELITVKDFKIIMAKKNKAKAK